MTRDEQEKEVITGVGTGALAGLNTHKEMMDEQLSEVYQQGTIFSLVSHQFPTSLPPSSSSLSPTEPSKNLVDTVSILKHCLITYLFFPTNIFTQLILKTQFCPAYYIPIYLSPHYR